MLTPPFSTPIAQQIWDKKYRFRTIEGEIIDKTVEDTWLRIAKNLASVENPEIQETTTKFFYSHLEDWKFIPAGRIIAGAGTKRDVTLFNCFVMGAIPDSMEGIYQGLKEAALTMKQGGGIGYDFSTLRPKNAPVKGVAAFSSGPLPFMDTWNTSCMAIESAGARRGAQMATMRCDHPDIMSFITAKREPGRLTNFNLSVLITDEFMDCLKNDKPWDLVFNGTVYETSNASELWNLILEST